jgi:hypothetical protein
MSPFLQRLLGLVLTAAVSSVNAQGIRQDQSHSYGNLAKPELEVINIPLDKAGFGDDSNLWVEVTSKDGPPRRVSGEALKGLSFYAPSQGLSVEYKIVDVRRHVSGGVLRDLWEYQVKFRMPGGRLAWLCRSKDSRAGDYAFAVPHALSKSGVVREDTGAAYFKFACVAHSNGVELTGGGAAAKCLEWGYPPWPQSGTPGRGTKPEALRFFGGCLFMAMADYCGEGNSNTFPNTRIGFADSTTGFTGTYAAGGWRFSELKKVPVGELSDGRARLEGFWNEKGALCISDRRWTTFSAEGTCIHALPSCASKPAQHWIDQGALFVSYATFSDSMLVSFKRGGKYLSTSKVEHIDEEPHSDKYRVVCDPELSNQLKAIQLDCDDWKQVGIEGPVTIDKLNADDEMLNRYTLPNGTIVTTTRRGYTALAQQLHGLPEDPGPGIPEGYIHSAEGEDEPCKERGTKALRLTLDRSNSPRTTSKRRYGPGHVVTLGCIQSVGRPDYLQPSRKAPPPSPGG